MRAIGHCQTAMLEPFLDQEVEKLKGVRIDTPVLSRSQIRARGVEETIWVA